MINPELKERFENQAYNLLREIEDRTEEIEDLSSDKYVVRLAFSYGILLGILICAIFEFIWIPIVEYVEVLILQ